MPANKYDVVIIGGGPAGLSAAIYTSRARLSTLLIERGMVGGLIINTEQVDNYPGFPEGISGMELTEMMHRQAIKYGLNMILADVTGLEVKPEQKVVKTGEGDFIAGAVIVACGSERNKMNVPGEDEFVGKGVSYCATCDAAFFRDKPVAVIGGGNAAVTEALHLSRFASSVTVIHRRNRLRATQIMQEKAFADPKIEFLWDTVVEAIDGGDFVKSIKLQDVNTGQKSVLDVAGIFVSIGFKPNTEFLKGVVPLDEAGAVITDERLETRVPGVYAAGDVRSGATWQVITAAGDGARAAIQVERAFTEYG